MRRPSLNHALGESSCAASRTSSAHFIMLAVLTITLLSSGCTRYGSDDAVADQREFNQAFENSDLRIMGDAAARFSKGVNSERFIKAGASYCTQDIGYVLQHEARRVQEIAIAWAKDRSASSALKFWDQLAHEEEKLDRRIYKCPVSERGGLESMQTLLALIRGNIRQNFDIAALRKSQEAEFLALLAQRRKDCNLEESHQKRIFQYFVRLEDTHSPDDRPRVINEVAQLHEISNSCVERIMKNAIYDHPDWLPEPM